MRIQQPSIEDQVLEIIRKIGGGVRVEEIAYQLARRKISAAPSQVADALHALEGRGLVTPFTWTLGIEAK